MMKNINLFTRKRNVYGTHKQKGVVMITCAYCFHVSFDQYVKTMNAYNSTCK